MIKKNLIIIIIFTVFNACNDKHVELYENGNLKKEYFLKDGMLNGNYKEFFFNGNLKVTHVYSNNKKIDSSVFYDKDDRIQEVIYYKKNSDTVFCKEFDNQKNILSKGFKFKGQKVKKWRFFKNGQIYKVNEYFIINGKQYTNQGWYFNKSGDTIIGKGVFMDLSIPKNGLINHEIPLKIFLKNPLISLESKVKLYVDLDPKNKINSDFSNLDKVRLIEINHHPENTRFAGSNLVYRTSGIKTIKGYLLEYLEKTTTKNNIFRQEHRIYFSISLHIN